MNDAVGVSHGFQKVTVGAWRRSSLSQRGEESAVAGTYDMFHPKYRGNVIQKVNFSFKNTDSLESNLRADHFSNAIDRQ